MIVKCTECHASYSVDDSKVDNKKFGFSCPKCGTNVIIDNRIKEPVEFPDLEMDDLAPESREEHVSHDTISDTSLPSEPVESSSDDFGELITDGSEFDMDSADQPRIKDDTSPGTTSDLEDFDSMEDIGDMNFDEPEQKKKSGSPEKSLALPMDDEPLTIDDFESTGDISFEVSPEDNVTISDFDDEAIASKEEGVRVDISEEDLLDNKDFDDLNSLDITDEDFKPLEEDVAQKSKTRAVQPVSDELSFNDDILDTGESDITEIDLDTDTAGSGETDADESITIDLDSLDIQLEEATPAGKTEFSDTSSSLADEKDISIDIDGSGDFDFNEELTSSVSEDTVPSDTEFNNIDFDTVDESAIERTTETDDDQDLTLDLDSLDITLDEIEEFKEGVQVDDDERLTIEDAGLTIDELESVKAEYTEEEDDEDLKLSIDEIDPDLRVEDLAPEISDDGHEPLFEQISEDELPEIDFDQLDDEESLSSRDDTIPPFSMDTTSRRSEPAAGITDKADYLDIETRERYESALEVNEEQRDTVPRGIVNFSIDYSLRYSRIGAILRLLGLYHVALIPHFIILLIYSILSNIVGVFNWLIVLFTGQQVEDFSGVQEKTLRYMLATNACMTNTVEEPPQFTGQKNIDHSLQLNVIYPAKPSKNIAFLRLTGIGIIIVALPHIVLFTLLTLGSTIIALVGIISIIATGSWPNILFDFMVRYYRYAANVLAFLIGLVDKYPSFRFE